MHFFTVESFDVSSTMILHLCTLHDTTFGQSRENDYMNKNLADKIYATIDSKRHNKIII